MEQLKNLNQKKMSKSRKAYDKSWAKRAGISFGNFVRRWLGESRSKSLKRWSKKK